MKPNIPIGSLNVPNGFINPIISSKPNPSAELNLIRAKPMSQVSPEELLKLINSENFMKFNLNPRIPKEKPNVMPEPIVPDKRDLLNRNILMIQERMYISSQVDICFCCSVTHAMRDHIKMLEESLHILGSEQIGRAHV